MLMIPDRSAPVAFGAATKLTVPLPVPDAAPLIVIQAAPVDAVHPQLAPAVTPIEPVPPAAATVCDVGAIENVHGTACCVTVSVWPPMVIVPLRAAPRFSTTVKTTTPLPVPDDPPVT